MTEQLLTLVGLKSCYTHAQDEIMLLFPLDPVGGKDQHRFKDTGQLHASSSCPHPKVMRGEISAA